MRIIRDCPKCGESRPMTRHHILPVRHFGRGKKNKRVFLLCRECHNDLEKLIPFELMPIQFYHDVLDRFLKGENQ